MFTYGMINRPAFEAAPSGWVSEEAHPDFVPFGVVRYDRELTAKELFSYQMALVDPLPAFPIYPVGSTVRSFKNGKTYTVDFWDGEFWIGDDPMPTDETWRSIRQWHQFEMVSNS